MTDIAIVTKMIYNVQEMMGITKAWSVGIMRTTFRVLFWPLSLAILAIALELISSTAMFDSFLADFAYSIAKGIGVAKNDYATVQEKVINGVRSYLNVISFVCFVTPLALQSVIRGFRAQQASTMLRRYGQQAKERIMLTINTDCVTSVHPLKDVNIRIFEKKGGRLVLKDIEGFNTHPIKRKVRFSIKRKEGLVTKCYKERKTMMERENGNKEEYNLTPYQLSAVGGLTFIVAIPICTENGNGIRRVVSIDTYEPVEVKNGMEDLVMKKCEFVAYDVSDLI